jgi:hypothetical protein
MEVDMSSYTSVLGFAAAAIKNKHPDPRHPPSLCRLRPAAARLHFERAHPGHEKVTQVNYLSNALLMLKLLLLLGATAVKTEMPESAELGGVASAV